jgi:mannose-6-phosphate isomerase-like protein (cupin superfamily)
VVDKMSKQYTFNGHNLRVEQQNPSLDHGPGPFVVDINKATLSNDTYRTAVGTGKHLQLTVMTIPVGHDIGLEVHHDHDQFLRVEAGQGLIQMGDQKDQLYFIQPVFDDSAIFIPAKTWHNLINTGNKPLKLYSIYAPPEHPKGVVHQTKEIAEAAERSQSNPYSTPNGYLY